MAWIPIRYREFYDVPRAFVVEHGGVSYFFDCLFDDAIDGYPDRYKVYRLATADAAVLEGSWYELSKVGVLEGEVPVTDVCFDTSRRSAVDNSVFALLR